MMQEVNWNESQRSSQKAGYVSARAIRLLAVGITAGFCLYVYFWLYRFVFSGYVLVAALLVLYSIAGVNFRLRTEVKHLLPLLTLMAYLICSVSWSLDPEVSRDALIANMGMPVVFLVAMVLGMHCSWADLRQFSFVTIIGLFAAAALTFGLHGEIGPDTSASVRTQLGLMLSTVFPIAAVEALRVQSIKYWLVVLGTIGLIVVLQSRAAYICIPLGLLGAALVAWPSRSKVLLVSLGATLALPILFFLGSLAFYYTDSDSAEFMRIGEQSLSFDLFSVENELQTPSDVRVDFERRLMTVSVLDDITEHPLVGTGYFGTYISTSMKYSIPISGHGLIAVVGELGILGCLALMGLFYHFWLSTRRSLSQPNIGGTLRICMICFMVFGIFHQIIESPFFYLMYGLGCGFGIQNSRRCGAMNEAN